MARNKKPIRFECGHPGCPEAGWYNYDNRADAARLYVSYGSGKYRCTRHSYPEQVLSLTNLKTVSESVSDQREHGRYWGNGGFVSGPGFKAFCADFPAGTTLRVTAEIILPITMKESPAT